MSLFEQINADIKSAMKAKEKEKLEALRAVKSAFLLAKTEKGGDGNIPESDELKIVQKLVKQRKDSAKVYEEQNRQDLADQELSQAAYIEAYLPKAMSEEELTAAVREIIIRTASSSMKDMGKVMGVATKELAGKVDGKTLSDKVKQMLS